MLGLPVSFVFVLKVRLVLADCDALVNDTPVQQLQTGLDTLTAPHQGVEPCKIGLEDLSVRPAHGA